MFLSAVVVFQLDSARFSHPRRMRRTGKQSLENRAKGPFVVDVDDGGL
jgi:hypothetical protein